VVLRRFLTVFACAFGLNVVAGDQYIALVLPSKVFRVEFARRGLAKTNLSRLAADSGTVTLPYAFFNIFSPVLSVMYGFTGFRIEKALPIETEEIT
jgi:NhaC family Na+:H+ antiporter